MTPKNTSLSEILLAAPSRAQVDAEFAQMMRDFIHQRGGLTGMAWRTGLAFIERARPGIVERATQKLLPEFMQALEPLYQAHGADGKSFGAYLKSQPRLAAEALIAVADRRMEQRGSDAAQKTYRRFRNGAEAEVERLIPLMAQLIQKRL